MNLQVYVIDIGGSKIEYLGFGKFIFYKFFDMPNTGSMEMDLNIIAHKLMEPILDKDLHCKVIISFPGLLQHGLLLCWPNKFYWKNLNLVNYFKKIFNTDSIEIEDDSNISIYFLEYLTQHSIKNLLSINIGTGIGMGIYINGKLFKGENGLAGELGHIKIENKNILCNCGQYDCLQLYASGKGMVDQFNRITNNSKIEDADFKKLNNLSASDQIAKETIIRGAELISVAIRNLFVLFDINQVYIFGSVILSNLYRLHLLKMLDFNTIIGNRLPTIIVKERVNASLLGAFMYGVNYKKLSKNFRSKIDLFIKQKFLL